MISALLAKIHHAQSASQMVNRLYYSSTGQIVVSAIFGFALALIFQRACKDRKCIVITAPPEVNEKVHKYKGECYKFTERYVECDLDDTDTQNGGTPSWQSSGMR